MQYYFLVNAFPEANWKAPLEMSFLSLDSLLRDNLTKKDLQLYQEFLLYIDLRNLKALLLEKPFDERGSLAEKEMREALLHRSGLPEYVFSFFDEYETKKERILHYAYIYATFFREQRKGFLAKYFTLERSIRLILTALRAKKWEKDIIYETQFETLDDPLVAFIIAQKDAKDFDPPEEFSDIKALFVQEESRPMQLEKQLLTYRLRKIEEFLEGSFFGVDAVLGYAVRLYLLESWHFVQEQKTTNILRKIVG